MLKNSPTHKPLPLFQHFLCLFVLTAVSFQGNAQLKKYEADPDPVVGAKLDQWQDLKFGLLMHWGPYSEWGVVESWSICPEDLSWASGARLQRGGEDYFEYLRSYEALKTTFNPARFNPAKWAMAAKEAGMKYLVFTTKHHDGFCMFDTRTTNYRVTDAACPFSKNPNSNITKAVFDAFRTNGFWVGAYFSKPDWHSDYYWWKRYPPSDRNPSYSILKHPEQWQKFVDYTHTQIKELMSGYGKIDILWLDGGWVRKKTQEELNADLNEVYENSRWARNPQSQDINMPLLVKEARTLQPGLIVVDREVPGPYQNYLTPEQHIPETGLPYPWETCMTMGSSWSYSPTDVYKPASDIIRKLVEIVSKGGNYLLNIGPGPDGEWSDTAYARLKEIGIWLKENGASIYGTRMYRVTGEGNRISYTQSKDKHFVYIFFNDCAGQSVQLNELNFPSKAEADWLGSGKKISWKRINNTVLIQVPTEFKSRGAFPAVARIRMDGF